MRFYRPVKLFSVAVLLYCLLVDVGESVPVPYKKDANYSNSERELALKFLTTYKYLLDSATADEKNVTEALKHFQKVSDIPITGDIDQGTINTIKLMKVPHCDVPDGNLVHNRTKRFTLLGTRWTKRRITYSILNVSPYLTRAYVSIALKKAYNIWSKFTGLKFEERVNPSKSDIHIGFYNGDHGDGSPFDGPGGVLAHGFEPLENSRLGGHIHFDIAEPWSDGTRDGPNFLQVAAHEIGHTLGVNHTDQKNALMMPYYSDDHSDTVTLHADDIAAVYELYRKRGTDSITANKVNLKKIDYDRAKTLDLTNTEHRKHIRPANWTPSKRTTAKKLTYDDIDLNSIDDFDSFSKAIPDPCNGYYDSVSLMDNNIFVFKGEYVWRLSNFGKIRPGYPKKTKYLFPGFSDHDWRIDASYERPDGSLVFFTGNLYWVQYKQKFIEDTPRPLEDLGLPNYVKKIDAVDRVKSTTGNPKDDMTFLYSDRKIWIIRGKSSKVVQAHPQYSLMDQEPFKNLDGVMTDSKGITFFFTNDTVWEGRLSLPLNRVRLEGKQSAGSLLFKCEY